MKTFESQILEPIFKNIEHYAERNAFCIADTFYTYRQLGERIAQMRALIRQEQLQNKIVGLAAHDSLDSYATIFALWAEGSAYVALHPNWPKERLDEIIAQAELEAIIDAGKVIRHDGNSPNENDLAYILFTSGSTGQPKGVMVSRSNLAAFVNSLQSSDCSYSSDDRALQAYDLTFDASVLCYLPTAVIGGCSYTVPLNEIKYVYAGTLMETHALTITLLVPSMLRYLSPYFAEMDLGSLRKVLIGADALPLSLVEEFHKHVPNAEIYNAYGPSECTVMTNYYKLNFADDSVRKTYNGIVSVGKAMEGVTLIVVDEEGKPLPAGAKGELCIASAQVTQGYWKNEELTRRAYFIREIDGVKMRFYRTGDLCYIDADGDVMYIGRIDFQAKIQGFRVELGEIEQHARAFLNEANVACLAFDNEKGLAELALFVETKEQNPEPLLQYLRSKMPHYMIPSRILFVPTFPLNGNGKTDRNKLKTSIKRIEND